MYPAFIQLETSLRMAEERLAARDVRRAAEKQGRSGPTTPSVTKPPESVAASDLAITIRLASNDDRTAILRLAELDFRKAPSGPMLLAIVKGHLWAALPLEDDEALADPFNPTAALVDLLRVRKALLHGSEAGRNNPWPTRLARSWRAFMGSDLSGHRSVPSHPTYWPSR
jgi:hypothetical protein